jgi:hypothetical protein
MTRITIAIFAVAASTVAVAEPLPHPKTGQCSGSYVQSGSYCVPKTLNSPTPSATSRRDLRLIGLAAGRPKLKPRRHSFATRHIDNAPRKLFSSPRARVTPSAVPHNAERFA